MASKLQRARIVRDMLWTELHTNALLAGLGLTVHGKGFAVRVNVYEPIPSHPFTEDVPTYIEGVPVFWQVVGRGIKREV